MGDRQIQIFNFIRDNETKHLTIGDIAVEFPYNDTPYLVGILVEEKLIKEIHNCYFIVEN